MKQILVSGAIETTDSEQYSEAIRPFNVELGRLSRDAFHSRTESLQWHGLMIYREAWSGGTHVEGTGPEGLNLLGVVDQPEIQYIWRGGDLAPSELALTMPGAEMDFFTPAPQGRHCVLLAPDTALVRHLGEDGLDALRRNTAGIASSPSMAPRFAAAINRMIGRARRCGPDRSADEAYCEALEFELFDAFVEFEPDPRQRPSGHGKARRQRVFRDAVERAEHLDGPIPIPEFARAIGVSRRTLEYTFHERLGISPSKFLRLSRINRLRHHLTHAEPHSTTVTTAAHAFGFTEPGRLAVAYREMFGETPSATLAGPKPVFDRSLLDAFA